MNITLQYNASEKNKVFKSVTDIVTLTGTLKTGTSIVDPVIIVAGDISDVVGCNYMSISEFGRLYFVNDIVSIKSNLFEVHGHCDVLSTYKDGIMTNSAIIKRQESKWNLYLNDGSFKVYQNPIVLTKAFPSGFTTQEFVLAVAGS